MATGKQLVQVGFMRRYDPGYGQLKKAIDSGKYGQPLMLHCVHRNYDAPGFTTSMPVENSMIHEIDVLRWLLGENYKTAEVVFPKTTRNAEGELRDPQIMYLTTESGVRIDVESFVNCRYGYDVRCEVVCEEGDRKSTRLQSPQLISYATMFAAKSSARKAASICLNPPMR